MSFDYSDIPVGYYDEIYHGKTGVRRAWHELKFRRVEELLKDSPGSILDIGCFAGSFLSRLDPGHFPVQKGIDMLPEQIEYASRKYSTPYRNFEVWKDLGTFQLPGPYQNVTLIEVIEHLTPEQIRGLFDFVKRNLQVGGHFVVSTPNYLSMWPLTEWLVLHLSDVTYEEQHITKFTYFNFERKLESIVPDWRDWLELEVKTTTHFLMPFLAGLNYEKSVSLSSAVDHRKWKFPFGQILLTRFKRVR